MRLAGNFTRMEYTYTYIMEQPTQHNCGWFIRIIKHIKTKVEAVIISGILELCPEYGVSNAVLNYWISIKMSLSSLSFSFSFHTNAMTPHERVSAFGQSDDPFQQKQKKKRGIPSTLVIID